MISSLKITPIREAENLISNDIKRHCGKDIARNSQICVRSWHLLAIPYGPLRQSLLLLTVKDALIYGVIERIYMVMLRVVSCCTTLTHCQVFNGTGVLKEFCGYQVAPCKMTGVSNSVIRACIMTQIQILTEDDIVMSAAVRVPVVLARE